MSYKESCLYTYRNITNYGAISKSALWSELDFDTKEECIDLIMSVDFGLKHRIDKEFAAKLYNWGNEERLEIFKAVVDDLMPKF